MQVRRVQSVPDSPPVLDLHTSRLSGLRAGPDCICGGILLPLSTAFLCHVCIVLRVCMSILTVCIRVY